MKIPQIIFAGGLLVLVVLLLTPRQYAPAYNADDEVRLHGVVEDVKVFYCPISRDEGTHLTVTTEMGKVQVHVAPSRFLTSRQWQFAVGDQVEVVGSKVIYEGHDAVIARAVARGNQTVAVRRANGKPLWNE